MLRNINQRNHMHRENRYLIFKIKDCAAALSQEEKNTLFVLSKKVADWRSDNYKPRLKAVVVESDWPEYEPTWAAISARVDAEVLASNAKISEHAPTETT
jgi:hypothetical protein